MSRFSKITAKSSVALAALATVTAVGVTAQSAAASPRVSPDACGAHSFWAELEGGQATAYVCGVSTKNLSGPDIYTGLTISDHANRIWLHQYPDGRGWAHCFEGRDTSRGISGVDRNPGNIQISSNTAPCNQ